MEGFRVGFTGSKERIFMHQVHVLRSFLRQYCRDVTEFHHGCCVGADEFAHHEAYALDIPIHYHPPTITDHMSDVVGAPGTRHHPKSFLARNKAIVNHSDILIAMPNLDYEIQRSGTWSTVRYARKHGKPIYIIYPTLRPVWEGEEAFLQLSKQGRLF